MSDDVRDLEAFMSAVVQYCGEDPCFDHIVFFVVAVTTADPDLIQHAWHGQKLHSESCGGCFNNVRRRAESHPNKKAKRIYRFYLQEAQRGWIEAQGGSVEVEKTDEGQVWRVKIPKRLDLPYEVPFTATEVLVQKDRSKRGYVIYDVSSEELFRNPEPLLQHFDETATRSVRDFEASETPVLHWEMICAANPEELQIRWQGQIKSIASGWTLQERYRKRLHREFNHHREREGDSSSAELMALHQLAEQYQEGRSWFAGFLSKTLRFRSADVMRAAQKDVAKDALSLDEEYDEGGTRHDRIEAGGEKSWLDHLHQLVADLDRDRLLPRIVAALTERQKEILLLKVRGFSDGVVGERVGLRRESVNREIRKIKEIAQKLRS